MKNATVEISLYLHIYLATLTIQFPRPARKNGHPVLFAIFELGFCDNYIEPP
jgi:hypothetical protein